MDEDTLEVLAELEHEQWMSWARSVQHEVSPVRYYRWQQYMRPYAQLPDDVKELDREWARRVLRVLQQLGWRRV